MSMSVRTARPGHGSLIDPGPGAAALLYVGALGVMLVRKPGG